MKEEIKIVPWTNGRYGVSNLGNVYSFFKEKRILHPAKKRTGYLVVNWIENGKYKSYNVHRLVAIMFLPNPDNLPCVNHKNEDKTDNRVENLEWCTYKYNSNYGTCQDKKRERQLGKRNPAYKLVCPLVLYTMKCIQQKTNKEILTELGIGSSCLHRKLREYKIGEIRKYKRKEEH